MQNLSELVLKLREDFEKRLGFVAEDALGEDNRCWTGYEPVPGKKAYEKGSCRKIGSKK